jgi:hypothetical protein
VASPRADAATVSAGERDAPPADRSSLLGEVSSERRRIYQEVRQILDELEQAAPWSLLYYPPDERGAFLRLVGGLVAVVESISDRLGRLVASMVEQCDVETRQALEDAEFFFHGIHCMVAPDLDRLQGCLAAATSSSQEAMAADERNLLSALTADLKGKYASALMGATASIVAEGRWTGVATEPVLFPEKAEEFRRNEELLTSLKRLLEAIARLPEEIDFSELVQRWRQGTRADQYALTELAAFRATLGRLLKSENRRALYSGDYQQIRQREALLSERIGELEALHRRLWDQSLPAAKAAGTYARLVEVALELAAILDIRLLEKLVGSGAVQRLRMVVTLERKEGGSSRQAEGSSTRDGLPPELRSLVHLLAEEDLRSFAELLVGAVAKRASFSLVAAVPASDEAAEVAEALELAQASEELTPIDAPPPATFPAASPSRSSPPAGSGAEAEGAVTQTRISSAPRGLSAREKLEAVEELQRILHRLQAPGNTQWAALRMLQRLLSKHSRVPPTMVHSSHPFLFEILNTLVPQLEVVASFGAVPADTRQKLVDNCMELSRPSLSPQQMEKEVPLALNRLLRLLEALTSVSGGIARGLRQEVESRG